MTYTLYFKWWHTNGRIFFVCCIFFFFEDLTYFDYLSKEQVLTVKDTLIFY